jgi:hypothetical protein
LAVGVVVFLGAKAGFAAVSLTVGRAKTIRVGWERPSSLMFISKSGGSVVLLHSSFQESSSSL